MSEMTSAAHPAPARPWHLLGIGLLAGILYGTLEGILAYVLSTIPGSLSWRTGNSEMALLFSPAFYAVLFLVLSVPFAVLALAFRRLPLDLWLAAILAGISANLLTSLQGQWFSGFAALMLGLGVAAVTFRWYRRSGRARLPRLGRAIVWVALVALVLGGGLNAAIWLRERWTIRGLPAVAGTPPNVLLLILDTQRADHMTPYGYERNTTPEIERLAAQSTVFEHAFSTSSWTLPAHASMFTGRPPHEHGAGERDKRFMDARYPVIAESLTARGYATGGFVGNRYWAGRTSGLSRGFIHYADYYGSLGDAISRTVVGRRYYTKVRTMAGVADLPGRKGARMVNSQLIDWLSGIGDRPFFIFANYFDVHAPYIPPDEVSGTFGGDKSHLDARERTDIGAWDESMGTPGREQLQGWINRYDEAALYMDREIGALMEELRRRNLLDNTLVIITSDHGEDFGEQGLIHHGNSLYLSEIRIPMIVRFPARFTPGTRVSAPVSISDVAATIAQVTGLSDSSFPGHSMLRTFEQPDTTRVVLGEIARRSELPKRYPAGRGWIKSLSSSQWHYMLEQSGTAELYNIATDPGERQNLATLPEHAALLESLRTRLAGMVPRGLEPSPRRNAGRGAADSNASKP